MAVGLRCNFADELFRSTGAFGFFDHLIHGVCLADTLEDAAVVHAETLVRDEGVDTNFDTIDDEEEADTTAAFEKTGAHFAIIDPRFLDA